MIWDLQQAIDQLDSGRVMLGSVAFLHVLKQHEGKVQSVAFSNDGTYLSTLGGEDDNNLVIWNVASGKPVCGYPAAADSEPALSCKWLHNRNDRFVTIGHCHVKVWQLDVSQPRLRAVDAKLGPLRRVFSCVDITVDDEFAYCGTTTGDLVKIKISRDEIHSDNDPDGNVPNLIGVSTDRIPKGVTTVCIVENSHTGNHNIACGGGDGTITYMNPSLSCVKKNTNILQGGITSICSNPVTGRLLVMTAQSNRYDLSRDLLDATLVSSCHHGPVQDISFPKNCSELLVSSSLGDVRIWNVSKKKELLRVQIPSVDCLTTIITNSGALVITGWDDGKIRAFTPETGKLKFAINDAHDKVTSLAAVDDDGVGDQSWRLISGGEDGKVRVWNITSTHRNLVISLKEHRGAVNDIRVNRDRSECVTASADGSCIVWDLQKYVRLLAFYEPNVFRSVVYHPDESQYMTCGSNRKLTYWDAANGEALREIEGGAGTLTALDVEPLEGRFVVSGGEDRLVKVWHYDEGATLAVGTGHSGVISAVKISPDLKTIASAGSSGEIILWELPEF